MYQRSQDVIDGRFFLLSIRQCPQKCKNGAHTSLDESVCLRYIGGKN
jgi:hypothetical protein